MLWEVKKSIKGNSPDTRRNEIVSTILANRGVRTGHNTSEFLDPPRPDILSPKTVGVVLVELEKALRRIGKALMNTESIVVYGDYDADGICATAILWETLHSLGANAMPFIPHRDRHGYGLSIKGIDEILTNPKPHTQDLYPERARRAKPSLIITVDNGIVAHQAVEYANAKGIDVIICDHHEPSSTLPQALAIVHTRELAGSAVAWIFCKEILRLFQSKELTRNASRSTLDLATIGTVADMVPLLAANRSIVKHGLLELVKTRRVGLLKMLEDADLNPIDLKVATLNFIIVPRLNAMGRLEHAMDSLRLLCTKDKERARILVERVNRVNRQRQELTDQLLQVAKELYLREKEEHDSIIVIEHNQFHEGIIGLIAGKLVEEFCRPAIVLTGNLRIAKASARSIRGFNIIEAIRKTKHLLIDAGGHPMAAGFTIKTEKIESFKVAIRAIAQDNLRPELLEPQLEVDCEIRLSDISWELLRQIEKCEPFGIGNPRPVMSLAGCRVRSARAIGNEGKHLSLIFDQDGRAARAIGFGLGYMAGKLQPSSEARLALSIERNVWKNTPTIQLKLRDCQK